MDARTRNQVQNALAYAGFLHNKLKYIHMEKPRLTWLIYQGEALKYSNKLTFHNVGFCKGIAWRLHNPLHYLFSPSTPHHTYTQPYTWSQEKQDNLDEHQK